MDTNTVLQTDYTEFYDVEKSNTGLKFNIGSVTYGQSKDIIIPVSTKQNRLESPPYLSVSLQYTSPHKQSLVKLKVDRETLDVSENSINNIMIHRYRLEFVHRVREAMNLMLKNDMKNAQKVIEKLELEIKSSNVQNHPFIIDLLVDLTGQVTEALSNREWFDRWGKHYLPSLTRAHLLQICNNFKDPGVQHYGSKLFNAIRDDMDEIFCKLPAPKPSTKYPYNNTVLPVNMRVFNNASAGCFHGKCLVLLADGNTKFVKDVRRGDILQTPDSVTNATVTYVMKSICFNDKTTMVSFGNGLIISPWHPVRIDGNWIFPCDIGHESDIECEEVFNFVLDGGHIVIINGVECVTLGHNFKGKVIEHPYYGTSKVLDDLRKLDTSNSGYVEIKPNWFVRDYQKTGLVSRILNINVGA
ncbi:unnamed protein product [Didymodactylos carnosus]|nr:unnamed protein product [Didymodactylos carnosus]CAF4400752.1 unnamed protein product [Didymodactylos carnosus]